MIYIKAYTRINLGDDLLVTLLCKNNPQQQFCILADSCYKDIFKDLKNLYIMSDEYEQLQKVKQNYSKFLELSTKITKKISQKCDTLIYIGGSIFIEFGSESVNRVKQLTKEVKMFKNSYIIGANFGPYVTKEYFNYIHDHLIPSLNYISFRDTESYNLFKNFSNVRYHPDIVFSMGNINKQKKKEVGFSLVYHLEREKLKVNYENYLNALSILIKRYISNGYKIRLLSFCSHEKDPIAIDNLLEKLSNEEKKEILLNYYDGNIEEFLDIFSKLDTVICTRFHSIVLGMMYSCNIIPICYSNKSYNLLTDLGFNNQIDFSNVEKILDFVPFKLDCKKIDALRKNAIKHFDYKKTILELTK